MWHYIFVSVSNWAIPKGLAEASPDLPKVVSEK